jgi:hypothetical protein
MKRQIVRGPVVGAIRTRPKASAFIAAALFLSVCSFTLSVSALSIYTLPPGGNDTAFSSPYPVGVGAPLATVTSPFISSTIDGTVISSVYSGDLSNPYGGLTFTYLLELSNSSTDSSSEMTVGSYGGFTVDVSYNQNGGGVAPSNFTRSGGTGGTIRFLWSANGGLQPGQNGALVVVQTGEQSYTTAQGGVIDSQTVNISALAPIPEPGIASLVLTCLGGLIFFARRRS